ncbi:MAG TPA: isopentenyl transferase family protein, partial [Synergistales bacterium]|nr:isopentenyl transferase family protein [Synergistales bacterium]
MTASPRELLSIIGPTASGKTQLSLELARRLDGEIISVDSRQVYRFMDVGTDKASPGVRREIPHHLIDVADPGETFSAADFAAGASRAVREILSRGKTPILAGGSPFYFKAFFTDVLHEGLERWDDSRGEFEKEWDRGGSQELYRRLGDLDPEYASR